MKNTGLIIALGVVSGIAVAATVALSTKAGRNAAEKATDKVKEVSGKAAAKTKEVSGKAVAKTKEVSGKVVSKVVDTTKDVSGKVISKFKKTPVEATCEEIDETVCECACACEETAAEEVVCDEAEELPDIAPEA
ncbi:MAG: hypothetical protein IJW00_07815 [Clostridia bacterium]|nr:hypothetical protein [Clostridia bacterium]